MMMSYNIWSLYVIWSFKISYLRVCGVCKFRIVLILDLCVFYVVFVD